MNITVRDLDEDVFRKFKGKAAERDLKMGVAVAQAMRLFIEKETKKPIKKQGAMRTSNWGKGSEATSEEINALLYGK